MNSYERIRAMTEGKKVDRPGIAGWMHLPLVDRCEQDFVRATIQGQQENRWDLVKVMYNGLYFTEAFGQKIRFSTQENEWQPTIIKHVIEHPAEFSRLKPVNVKEGAFAREIEATKKIVDNFKEKVPVVATIFTPITWASEMYCGWQRTEMMAAAMKYSAKDLHNGLEAITDTNIRFCEELVKAGIDGIFYASHYCSGALITKEEHEEFNKPYDLAVLDAVKRDTWFNLLHLHTMEKVMFEEFEKYPVQALNWEDIRCTGENRISLEMGRKMSDKIFIGGLDQHRDLISPENDREAVKRLLVQRIRDAVSAAGPDRLIIGPGCAFPNTIPQYRYQLIAEAMEEVCGERILL